MDRVITKEWENFQRLAKLQGNFKKFLLDYRKVRFFTEGLSIGYFLGFVFDRHLLDAEGWRAKWRHS